MLTGTLHHWFRLGGVLKIVVVLAVFVVPTLAVQIGPLAGLRVAGFFNFSVFFMIFMCFDAKLFPLPVLSLALALIKPAQCKGGEPGDGETLSSSSNFLHPVCHSGTCGSAY